jgi:hypothetical protein
MDCEEASGKNKRKKPHKPLLSNSHEPELEYGRATRE